MELIIKYANNGFIVEWEEEVEKDYKIKKREVFEEDNSEDGELKVMKKMLWFVKDHFGVTWSKHNEINLDIKLEKLQKSD